MEETIKDINSELRRLNELKANLLKEESEKTEEFIRNLTWTHNCSARLEITGFLAAGLPKYKIYVFGNVPKTPEYKGVIHILGDSKFYQDNVVFTSNDYPSGFSCFYTNSESALIELMSSAIFKSFEYDEKQWRVLDAARKIYDKNAKPA